MLADIEEAIRVSRESAHAASTSDLHLEGNEPPWHRVDGAMCRMELPVTEPESVRAFCETYLSKKEYERLTGPAGSADGAIGHPNFGAIRIHAFRGENGLALSLRLLRDGVPELSTLGLPPIVSTFADFPTGLVLFTGPTGSGKSTALAGLVNEINKKYERHIVTVEDPIEYRHRSKRSLIRQREVGRDVSSYGESLRGVLRADPDERVGPRQKTRPGDLGRRARSCELSAAPGALLCRRNHAVVRHWRRYPPTPAFVWPDPLGRPRSDGRRSGPRRAG